MLGTDGGNTHGTKSQRERLSQSQDHLRGERNLKMKLNHFEYYPNDKGLRTISSKFKANTSFAKCKKH